MDKIKHFILPEHTNTLYENEIVDVLNEFSNDDIEWK